MGKRYRKSIKIAEHLGTTLRQLHNAQAKLYCWKMEELGIKYTEYQKEELSKADNLIAQSEAIVNKVFKEILGDLMVKEIKRY